MAVFLLFILICRQELHQRQLSDSALVCC